MARYRILIKSSAAKEIGKIGSRVDRTRIVYVIDDSRLEITVFKVGHRKDVYR